MDSHFSCQTQQTGHPNKHDPYISVAEEALIYQQFSPWRRGANDRVDGDMLPYCREGDSRVRGSSGDLDGPLPHKPVTAHGLCAIGEDWWLVLWFKI